jgi:hypothetical protein
VIDSKKERSEEAPQKPPLSKKEMKQRKEKLAVLKERIKNRLAEKEQKQKMVKPEPAPRYDDVFFDGVARLDEAAGTPILPSAGEITFSDDVWKSRARSDEGLS